MPSLYIKLLLYKRRFEITKDIEINGCVYHISDTGIVYGKHWNIIKQRPDDDGYSSFTAGKKNHRTRIRTHRIVGKIFVDNPNNYNELDHLDCNRMNPSANNLEWVTHQENINRIKINGNRQDISCEKNPRAKLTKEVVVLLRNEFKNGATQKEISIKYNIPWSTVHNIVTYNTWKEVI